MQYLFTLFLILLSVEAFCDDYQVRLNLQIPPPTSARDSNSPVLYGNSNKGYGIDLLLN